MMNKKMTLLDIVEKHPESEQIIREYDKVAGVCLLCECLFNTIKEIEISLEINLEELYSRLTSLER